MSISIQQNLPNEEATLDFGRRLSECLRAGAVIYLHGELGAGKTTLVRGVLQGLGHSGRVKSPTYTLVERYDLQSLTVFHFDLYRLADPEELEFLGIRDYLDEKALLLVEWPERGSGFLSNADVDINLSYQGDGRSVDCMGLNSRGDSLLQSLKGQ